MLRVVDLLALPAFENFRLISNGDGLYNKVESISILDWESPKEIRETFRPDDIVFNMMYMNTKDRGILEEGMRTLIKMRVGAIAIKTPDPDVCSEEIIELANIYRIPVFLYENEYLEDLIYIVRHSIDASDSNGIALGKLRELMRCEPGEIVATAQKINPQFFNEHICMCCIPSDKKHDTYSTAVFEEILDDTLKAHRKTLPQNIPNPKSHDAVIRCDKCIIVILTGSSAAGEYSSTLAALGIDTGRFAAGISRKKDNLFSIKDAVSEAIIASLEALIFEEDEVKYEDVGANSLIIPLMQSKEYQEVYFRILNTLKEYDEKHSTDLLETLMCYIKSEQDIALTAKSLYQHGNTIRYRINKIRQLTGVADGPDGQMQLLVFARMHRINQLIGGNTLV